MLSPLTAILSLPSTFDGNLGKIMVLYGDALDDMPFDLLVTATRGALRNLKWFPKPAELREQVSEELARRVHVVQRLGMALQVARATV